MKRTLAFPPELKQTTTLLPTIITTLIATTTGYAKYNYTFFLFSRFYTLRISRNIQHILPFLKKLEKGVEPKRCHRYRNMQRCHRMNKLKSTEDAQSGKLRLNDHVVIEIIFNLKKKAVFILLLCCLRQFQVSPGESAATVHSLPVNLVQ